MDVGQEPFYEEEQPEERSGRSPGQLSPAAMEQNTALEFEEPPLSRELDAPAEEGRSGAGDEEPGERTPRPARRPARRGRSGGLRDTVVGGPRFMIPLILIAALATLVVSILFTRLSDIHWGFWFYLALFVVTAQFDVDLSGGGKVNLGLAPLLAALFSLPPVQVVWIFLFGTLAVIIVKLLSGEVTKDELLGMLLDYTGVGIMALVFKLVVELLPKKPVFFGEYWPGLIAAVGLAAIVYFFVQLLGTTYVLSQEGYFPAGAYLSSTFRGFWLPYVAIACAGMLMGLIYNGINMWSVLFVVPFLPVLRYAYNRVAATDQYLLETVRTLAAIPEETGMVPAGHSEDVASLSVAVARELGLSPEDASQVEYAAYLHDIGAITRSCGPEAAQQQLYETEGVIAGGGDVLGRVRHLAVASEILKGREGLSDRVDDAEKRKAVSMGAGILRAVDDFVCLLHGSEEREPLSESRALSEMNLERGIKYDSKVLRAIARVLSRLPTEGLPSIAEGSAESSPFWGEQES